MPSYNADHAMPPAPFAWVTIRNFHTGKSIVDVPMLMDTGADASLIPRIVIEALGITPIESDTVRLVGFDGNTSNAVIVRVDLQFLEKTYRGDFLLAEGTYGIIGRDILNRHSLWLDGPRLSWEELSSA